ncbi:protein PHYTOCHROME KINASE SUBSTRATE 3-like [Salvia hispanica]|uniref:protein PHYTOCHROME KINASE SUBSTRATE 3-like n=1 Tax=Salvia hispanica TaxID=49212 RepID=UPI002009D401|nr:protein PHYTOCHROME KINASE SUBSTRATE 3-like [Salvia hispanica]
METQDGSSLRVASFSSYIDKGKESLVHRVSAQDHTNMTIKLSNPTRVDSFSSRSSEHNPNSAFTFSHLTPKHAGAGEISVFGADRYFNMKLEYQTKTHPPTPSLCSESSAPTTCHSQTTLLPSNQPSKHKKTASRIFTGFGCKTPCFGYKSVQIDEIKDHPIKKIQDIEESRKSIEVFGSRKIKDAKGSEVATNMERKLSMLTWDAIPKGGKKNLPTSTIGSTSEVGDVASEASSDLFEIEEVSGSIYPLMQGADDDDDDEPSCMMSPATSLYAPSEASIQWSVVTASAADFSGLSEFNDDSVSAKVVKTRVVNQVQKSRPTGLLGCKSIKAVDVANQNVCVKGLIHDPSVKTLTLNNMNRLPPPLTSDPVRELWSSSTADVSERIAGIGVKEHVSRI